jgi:aldehyde:ferredoxin oxidoreductase
MNASGVCLFAYTSFHWPWLPDFLEAVTGWEWPLDIMRKTGDRIGTLRHLFSLREGINPLRHRVPDRVVGVPPQTTGPLQGVTIDYKTMVHEYVEYVGWDPVTAVPGKKSLEELGLGDLVPQFHQK